MKKGFTLVEMLGVIVIVGLIVLLVIPFVTTVINNSKQKMYEQQLKNIELAAKTWGSENTELLPKSSGSSITIFLYNLKFDGFITKDIKNPVTGEQIPDDLAIQITKKGKSYNYEVLSNTGGEITTYDPTRFRVILNGAINQHVELNSSFAGVSTSDILLIGTDNEIITSATVDITITEQNKSVIEILVDTPGVYSIEYKVNYDGEEQSVFRTINVSDTLSPTITFDQPTYLLVADCSTFNVGDGVTITDNSGSWTLDITGTLTCEVGDYTLIYIATDIYGNVNEKERTIKVVNQLPGGEEFTGDIVEETADVVYINHPTAMGYPANATPCTINTFDFTHIKDKRDETVYPVTKIGTQCWFGDNLVYTTASCLGSTWGSAPFDGCVTHEYNGRTETFYQWEAIMNGSSTEGAQGLCPVGWHVPTDAEWHTLENLHGPATCDSTRMGWDCNPAGEYLKADRTGYNGVDFYGYNGGLAGMVNTFGSRTSVGTGGVWWSSTNFDATSSRHRFVSATNTGVTRGYYNSANGIAGRCIMNP